MYLNNNRLRIQELIEHSIDDLLAPDISLVDSIDDYKFTVVLYELPQFPRTTFLIFFL
ncbi:hypothetical protein IC582_006611 [Cucumis melo]